MNVSGHRLSTMELESALVRHPAVAEAAVVGKPHEITGQAVACFVTLKKGDWNHDELAEDLRKWVAHEIGSFAKARADPLHRRAAKDPQRQNHAPPAA
jgi:acetyl-CoA synthetase